MYIYFCIKEIIYDEFTMRPLSGVAPIGIAQRFIKFCMMTSPPLLSIRTIIKEVLIEIFHHEVIQPIILICYSSNILKVLILNTSYEMCDALHIIMRIMI